MATRSRPARPRARVATSVPSVVEEVLHQLADNTAQTARTLDAIVADLKDVRERVIRLEASDVKRSVEKLELRLKEIETHKADAIVAADLESRINALESERDQVKGVSALIGWLSKNAPWLAAALIGAFAYFKR
jgi:hypothetical protein